MTITTTIVHSANAIALNTKSEDKYGVFFCTRDLSQELYEQIEKGKIASSIFLSTSSSSAIASSLLSSLSFKIILPASIASGAGVAYLSTNFVHDWYKKGFYQKVTESLNSISSVSMSGLHNNYVNVNDTVLMGNTYRHCSVLLAQYNDEQEGRIRLKSFDTKGFFQDEKGSSPLYGNQNTAVDRNDLLDSSTVCTLVKKAKDKREYFNLRAEIFDFFSFETDKGYSLTERNCCTVTYNAVKKIDGNTNVIDNSSFNHGIGMPHDKSWFSFLAASLEDEKNEKTTDDL